MVKLNIKWQMAFLAIKIYIDITDGIASLASLYWFKNFKPCNKHLWLLVKYVGFITKKIPVDEFLL